MTWAESIPSGRSDAFERDRVVRLVADDGYHVHRLIYEALAKDGVRDFLFAPFAVTGGLHVVLVRSRDVRTRFAEGQRFQKDPAGNAPVETRGGLDFGIVDTSSPKGQVSTKSGQLHLHYPGRVIHRAAGPLFRPRLRAPNPARRRAAVATANRLSESKGATDEAHADRGHSFDPGCVLPIR